MLILNKNSETVKPKALLRQDKAARGVSYGITRNPGAPINSDLWARAELFDAAMNRLRGGTVEQRIIGMLAAIERLYPNDAKLFFVYAADDNGRSEPIEAPLFPPGRDGFKTMSEWLCDRLERKQPVVFVTPVDDLLDAVAAKMTELQAQPSSPVPIFGPPPTSRASVPEWGA
jgi:hypothetical protein